MQLKSAQSKVANEIRVAIRPARSRLGGEHVYKLNGSELRDVLIDGRCVTLSVTATPSHAV
ncbi:hypothetical protein C7H84_29840 [Burkholderia sp. Nafp2/4-1b]|nr:hypothetical protein C7H84_29840 [Burkholderia sp. Nafp2/4-1b]